MSAAPTSPTTDRCTGAWDCPATAHIEGCFSADRTMQPTPGPEPIPEPPATGHDALTNAIGKTLVSTWRNDNSITLVFDDGEAIQIPTATVIAPTSSPATKDQWLLRLAYEHRVIEATAHTGQHPKGSTTALHAAMDCLIDLFHERYDNRDGGWVDLSATPYLLDATRLLEHARSFKSFPNSRRIYAFDQAARFRTTARTLDPHDLATWKHTLGASQASRAINLMLDPYTTTKTNTPGHADG